MKPKAAVRKTKLDKVPITIEQRRQFEGYILKWQRLLNMMDWRIGLSAVHCKDTALAMVSKFDLGARVSTIRLAVEWDENNPTDDWYLEQTALHEMLHIFLHEMLQFVGDHNANEADKESAEHRVIQALCALLVPQPGSLED